MKRILALFLTLLLTFTMFSATALAKAKAVNYYDESGNQITVNGLYYNSQGYPMFNSSCYYLDENGNAVYVGGCQAYYYDTNGNLNSGNYYYDTNGKAVPRPSSYPGGWGCGAWYYNEQGNVVNSTVYYDDFGNAIDLPENQSPVYRNAGGACCSWRR